jgi:WD40 repeat protein
MFLYHMYQADPLRASKSNVTQQQNFQLLVLKYQEALATPYKLKANREFLMLQKILLRDQEPSDFQGLKRIEVYDDELSYLGKQSVISSVQMSSEPHRNFFLIVMDSIVYKYDLVTKELLFKFKTNASKEMILYDADDKLCVASDNTLRLWDFYDNREAPPELWASHEFRDPVQSVFLNENSRGPFVFIVATTKHLFVFEQRLSVRHERPLDFCVLSAAFNQESTLAYIGTESQILIYDLILNIFTAVAIPGSATQI